MRLPPAAHPADLMAHSMALSPGSRGWRCQPHALVCELASTSPEPKYLLHIFWVPELTWDFTATEMVTLRMPVAGCQAGAMGAWVTWAPMS